MLDSPANHATLVTTHQPHPPKLENQVIIELLLNVFKTFLLLLNLVMVMEIAQIKKDIQLVFVIKVMNQELENQVENVLPVSLACLLLSLNHFYRIRLFWISKMWKKWRIKSWKMLSTFITSNFGYGCLSRCRWCCPFPRRLFSWCSAFLPTQCRFLSSNPVGSGITVIDYFWLCVVGFILNLMKSILILLFITIQVVMVVKIM